MSWKSNGALKRLGNTFKRLYEKKLVYKEDFEALKTLQEEINNLTEQRITEQTLFAKVVCVNLRAYLVRFGNIKEAIKWVQMDLNIHLVSHVQELTNELNLQDLQNLMKQKGINFELVTSIEEKENNLKVIKEHEKEFVNKILEPYKYESVKKSFEKTINEFIINPENYS
jgi:hypothetical protein